MAWKPGNKQILSKTRRGGRGVDEEWGRLRRPRVADATLEIDIGEKNSFIKIMPADDTPTF